MVPTRLCFFKSAIVVYDGNHLEMRTFFPKKRHEAEIAILQTASCRASMESRSAGVAKLKVMQVTVIRIHGLMNARSLACATAQSIMILFGAATDLNFQPPQEGMSFAACD